ncbi:hypothetical protein HA402_000891 [Bradysia odoriphaga]|nr:hypothetical protein HA402_000891 [Bradysia odoriphaga]
MDNVYEFYGEVPEPEKGQQVTDEVRRKKPRGRTDFFFFILNAGFIFVLFILFFYCFFNGSIYRKIYGYDECGNVCGLENSGNEDQSCQNPDKRNSPLLRLDELECVHQCPSDSVQHGTICLPAGIYLVNGSAHSYDVRLDVIGISLAVAIGFAYIILVSLRHFTKFVVWFVVGAFALLMLLLLILCLYAGEWLEAIVFIVIGVILLLLFIRRKDKMEFVIKLFKEAAKSLMDMPMLLFEPLLTVLSLIIATFCCVYFMLVIDSAGTFNKALYQFEQNAVIKFTYWLNIFVYFWFVQFILGCQHFVAASTVSQWYFTRNKSLVRRPVCNAFSDLIIFHLGTICLGSLLLTLIKILRCIMNGIKRSIRQSNNILAVALVYVYDFLLRLLEDAISFLTSNAYIVTAIDGLPFIAAGKRAVHLIFTNFGEKLAAELVGDIVVWTCKLFIFFTSLLVSYELLFSGDQQTGDGLFSFCIIIVLAFLVTHVMLGTFESTIDTLFVCYSIDTEENDGVVRPFFMSESLKNTMFEAKQLGPPMAQQV